MAHADKNAKKKALITRRRKRGKRIREHKVSSPSPKKHSANPYLDRWRILRELGYSSYDEYLMSPLWEKIRKAYLYGKECVGCGGRANQLHHLDYLRDTLLGKNLKRLLPLCKVCHERCEFSPEGKKYTYLEMLVATRKLLRSRKSTQDSQTSR